MTKLMTVLVALEHADLDDVVTVSPLAARVGESSVNLRAGAGEPILDECRVRQCANRRRRVGNDVGDLQPIDRDRQCIAR